MDDFTIFNYFRNQRGNVDSNTDASLEQDSSTAKDLHIKQETSSVFSQTKIKSEPNTGKKRSLCNHSPQHESFVHSGKNYPKPDSGVRRVIVREPSPLQIALEHYKDTPVPGLESMVEIRKLNKKNLFYCEICDSLCTQSTVSNHLIGLRHAMQYLKFAHPLTYESYRYKPKKLIADDVKKFLMNYESQKGRGVIKVEQEHAIQPSLNTHSSNVQKKRQKTNEFQDNLKLKEEPGSSKVKIVDENQGFDKAINTFNCELCNVTAHSLNIWADHLAGKKHMKNQRRQLGETVMKDKWADLGLTASHLGNTLKTLRETVVGLECLKETQYKKFDKYLCTVCKSPLNEDTVVKHLLGAKHKIKYLILCNENGKQNKIDHIRMLPANLRVHLLEEECKQNIQKYGIGQIKVFKSSRY